LQSIFYKYILASELSFNIMSLINHQVSMYSNRNTRKSFSFSKRKGFASMRQVLILVTILAAQFHDIKASLPTLRRMRKVIEVSDLNVESDNMGTTTSEMAQDKAISDDLAQRDLFRLLNQDTSFSMKMPSISPLHNIQPFPTNVPTLPSSRVTTSTRDELIRSKCGFTSKERSAGLYSIVSSISDTTKLENPTSSAYQALDWLDNVDSAVLCLATDRVKQRYVSAVLYYSLAGSEWKNCGAESEGCIVKQDDEKMFKNIRWLNEAHECLWFGLHCEGNKTPLNADEISYLTDIDLDDNNLVGSLPEELFELGSIQTLIMDSNKLFGNIPSEISLMTNLNTIDLDDNALDGTLPTELFNLTKLEIIDLNSNKFIGTLPSEIRNLVNIKFLQLDFNYLTGSLPAKDILPLKNIFALTLESNELTGSAEVLCDVLNERRKNYTIYLQFFQTDCAGELPEVYCPCCSKCI